MPSFAESFLQGMMAGRAEQERKKQLAMQEQRMASDEAWRKQQGDLQRVQAGQQDAKTLLDVLKTQPMPRAELPPDQAGPAAPAPRPTVRLPLLGGGVQELQPLYAEDVATQARASKDAEMAAQLELLRRQAQIRNEGEQIDLSNMPEEARFGLSGVVDPKVYEGARAAALLREQINSRKQLAGDAAAARKAAADSAKSDADAELQSYVDRVRSGEWSLDQVPQKAIGKVSLLVSQSQPELFFPTKKDKQKWQELDEIERTAQTVLSQHKPEFTGVGGFWPSRLQSGEQTQFNAALADLNTALKKARIGGAQSAQELASMAPFLPAPTDTDTQVLAKLKAMIGMARQRKSVYSRGAGTGGGPGGGGPSNAADPGGLFPSQ